MSRLLFDVETNGFLDTLTTIHCLWIRDLDTGETFDFHNQHDTGAAENVADGLRMLMKADLLVGHNVIKFDLPAIQKVYPWFTFDPSKVFDTVVASRLIWTDLVDTDMTNIRGGKTTLPPKLVGWHSLEAWGHRMGQWKGDYAEVMKERGLDPWGSWNEEMHAYCGQDIEVNEAFYRLIERKQYSPRSLQLEMDVCVIIARMERNGFGFNVEKAEALVHKLSVLRAELGDNLRDIFQPWWVPDGKVFTPKRDNAKMGYVAGVPVQKIKLNVFNPSSNDQIADRFTRLYGWEPEELTPSGKAKIDETVLEALPYPEAKELARYKMIQKRLGQIAEGDQAWLKNVKPDGRVYTTTNTGGTVTGRASHSNFNIGQVPAVDAEFGPECRECFGPRPGRKQLGCDVSGLELRMLGHFMAAHDGGEYAKEVVDGDVHTKNQLAAGLPTRNNAKTFIYAFLYGAGDGKIGSIIGKGREAGRDIKEKFFETVPALRLLIEGIQKKVGGYQKLDGPLPMHPKLASRRGYKRFSNGWFKRGKPQPLRGLDGRLLHIRSDHAALNTLLQSAGAVVCKTWIVEFDRLLTEHGLQDKVAIMAWVHDELQMEIDPDLVREDGTSIVGELCVKAIAVAGTALGIRVPLTGEYKIGNNWKDCH
jgi:DNA polymerase I-like protein with 3'-5' exonuclease and polymerase domains